MNHTKAVLGCAAAAVCILFPQDLLFAAKLKDFKKVVIADFSYEQMISNGGGNSKGVATAFSIGELDGKKLFVNPKYFLKEALAEFTLQLKAGGLEIVDPAEARKAFAAPEEKEAPKEAAKPAADANPQEAAMSEQQEAMKAQLAAMEPKLKEMEKTNPAAAAKMRAALTRAMGGGQEQLAAARRPGEAGLKAAAASLKKNKEEEEAKGEAGQFAEERPDQDVRLRDMEDLSEMAGEAKNDKAKKKAFAEVMRTLGADAYLKVSFNGGVVGRKTSTLNINNQSVSNRGYMAVKLELFNPESKSLGTPGVTSAYSKDLVSKTYSASDSVGLIMEATKNAIAKQLSANGIQ